MPASVVLHAMAFAALLLWGDRVTTQDAHVPSVIAVRLVEAPTQQAQSAPPAPEVKAQPEAGSGADQAGRGPAAEGSAAREAEREAEGQAEAGGDAAVDSHRAAEAGGRRQGHHHGSGRRA